MGWPGCESPNHPSPNSSRKAYPDSRGKLPRIEQELLLVDAVKPLTPTLSQPLASSLGEGEVPALRVLTGALKACEPR